MGSIENDGDLLANLFVAASKQSCCREDGDARYPGTTVAMPTPSRCHRKTSCITSEAQWRSFTDLLAKEGFVTEQTEQQRLQKLWNRALSSAHDFGRRGELSLVLEEVQSYLDRIYTDEASARVERNIEVVQESVAQVGALFKSRDIQTLTATQTRQVLQLLSRLEESNHRAIHDLEKKYQRDCEVMLKGTVERAQLKDDLGRAGQGELGTVDAADDFSTHNPCNPVLWQANNAALVEREVLRSRVKAIRYPPRASAGGDAIVKGNAGLTTKGRNMDYPWDLSQYLGGTQGIYCRSGMASRERGEEFPVTVLVMPKQTGPVTYHAREKLWRAFLAHRQLVASRCTLKVLGFFDTSPKETLFYLEHMKVRGVLLCVAKISEQSTYSLEGWLTSDNVMIGEQGALVLLGRLRWGAEVEGGPDGPDSSFLERDAHLSAALADIFEEFLGPSGKPLRDGSIETAGDKLSPSPALASIIAWLRLPLKSRRSGGMTLQKLTEHRYFAPLSAVDRQTALTMAWNAFIGAE